MLQTIQFDLMAGKENNDNLASAKLPSAYIELCNLLKMVGLADSGGRGKAMVAEGLVKVDGATELRKTAKIRSGQRVLVAGHTIVVK